MIKSSIRKSISLLIGIQLMATSFVSTAHANTEVNDNPVVAELTSFFMSDAEVEQKEAFLKVKLQAMSPEEIEALIISMSKKSTAIRASIKDLKAKLDGTEFTTVETIEKGVAWTAGTIGFLSTLVAVTNELFWKTTTWDALQETKNMKKVTFGSVVILALDKAFDKLVIEPKRKQVLNTNAPLMEQINELRIELGKAEQMSSILDQSLSSLRVLINANVKLN